MSSSTSFEYTTRRDEDELEKGSVDTLRSIDDRLYRTHKSIRIKKKKALNLAIVYYTIDKSIIFILTILTAINIVDNTTHSRNMIAIPIILLIFELFLFLELQSRAKDKKELSRRYTIILAHLENAKYETSLKIKSDKLLEINIKISNIENDIYYY